MKVKIFRGISKSLKGYHLQSWYICRFFFTLASKTLKVPTYENMEIHRKLMITKWQHHFVNISKQDLYEILILSSFNLGDIHASPRTKGWHWKSINLLRFWPKHARSQPQTLVFNMSTEKQCDTQFIWMELN